MSSYGPRKELEALMEEWLELSLHQKVPTALLILSRAYRLLPHQVYLPYVDFNACIINTSDCYHRTPTSC